MIKSINRRPFIASDFTEKLRGEFPVLMAVISVPETRIRILGWQQTGVPFCVITRTAAPSMGRNPQLLLVTNTMLAPMFLTYFLSRILFQQCISVFVLHLSPITCLSWLTPRDNHPFRTDRTAPTARELTGLLSKRTLKTGSWLPPW
jgi:hypothetical protein